MNKWYKLATVFAVFNILDIITTLYSLNTGNFYEVNPIMKFCLDIGPLFFIFVKLWIIPVMFWVANKAKEFAFSRRALWICTIMYGIVIVNNISQLVKLFFF